MKYEKKELYGGAITVQLPTSLTDASNLRQIPDTQEVFISSDRSEIHKDDAIIIDLLERQDNPNDPEALQYHLSEISKLNGVAKDSQQILYQSELKAPNFPGDYAAIIISGEQAKKWGRDETVLILVLGLIRISKSETDLLVSYNVPFHDADELEDLKKTLAGDGSGNGKASARIEMGKEAVLKAIESIKIENWSLFG
ncbi:unnamed protein product [Ambrosiozyma monospora]|uniref:Unnamed protein product n=1 Tax=Ambrosiozyma monospora TaxID=43982 RepID=A0ACB5SSL2_AMBMO|nr:unnamed protein product [Ambrosiozyma monospora]